MVTSLKIDAGSAVDDEKAYCCKKCNKPYDARVRRGFFVKTFLFWLPLRRYACYRCKGTYYVFR